MATEGTVTVGIHQEEGRRRFSCVRGHRPDAHRLQRCSCTERPRQCRSRAARRPARSRTGCGTTTRSPPTRQCADAFHTANPEATVKITQYAWDDYWSGLSNGFVAGTAPDVFTNHLSKYPEFVTQGQLVALDDALAADGVKTDIYQKGLAELWIGQDGKRYGLPKDFDTVAIFYNKKLIKDAGVTDADLLDPDLEPNRRRQLREDDRPPHRGCRPASAGMRPASTRPRSRCTAWAWTAAPAAARTARPSGACTPEPPAGRVTDKNPWGTHYNYDKPEFQDTITWMRSLIEKGYMPSIEAVDRAELG